MDECSFDIVQPIAIAIVVWTSPSELCPDGTHDWVLIGPRAENVPLAGQWEFPGGKVHPGETQDKAAVRECLEESGLAVRCEKLLDRRQHTYQHGTLELSFYLCRVEAGPTNFRPVSNAPFRWVPVSDLVEYRFPQANQAVIEQLLKWPSEQV